MSEQTIDLIYNITGIIGIGLIVLAFFLIQTGKITSTNMAYPMLNFVGAALHLVSLYRFYNLPSVIIEIFWIAISVYGIFKARQSTN
jgi:multidrug transporter EmrE-like cation transporter